MLFGWCFFRFFPFVSFVWNLFSFFWFFFSLVRSFVFILIFFWFVVRRTSRGQIQFVLDAFIKSTQWVAVSSPVFFSRKKDTDFFCCCCFSFFFVQKYWVYGSFDVVGTLMWQQDNNNDTNDDIELSFSCCYE